MVYFQNMKLTQRQSLFIKAALKEPLVHFLVLGGLLFAIASYTNNASTNNTQTIVITNEQIEQLHTKMNSLLRRELTPAEMQKAIDDYVTEEVLLREGLKLGVVEEDAMMRKAVAEKVTFLLSDTTMVSEPTEGMLQDFMQKNATLFTQPVRRSFMHIYFDPSKHTGTLEADIKQIQQKIAGKTKIDPLIFSDTFVSGNEYQQADEATISRFFGNEFSSALFSTPLNTWSEPINSKFGVHLVLVSEALPASQPPFSQIREQVHKLYMEEQHHLQNQAAINQLKQQYHIIIQQPDATP